LIRCCNTAWLSEIREKQGGLFFPVERLKLAAVPERDAKDALLITIFHHPYSWLATTNARNFRKAIEESSDVVLTGHEHDFTKKTVTGLIGEVNQYIEGGALQEHGS